MGHIYFVSHHIIKYYILLLERWLNKMSYTGGLLVKSIESYNVLFKCFDFWYSFDFSKNVWVFKIRFRLWYSWGFKFDIPAKSLIVWHLQISKTVNVFGSSAGLPNYSLYSSDRVRNEWLFVIYYKHLRLLTTYTVTKIF